MNLVAFWNRSLHAVEVHAEGVEVEAKRGFDKLVVIGAESKQHLFTKIREALVAHGVDSLKIDKQTVSMMEEGQAVATITLGEGLKPDTEEPHEPETNPGVPELPDTPVVEGENQGGQEQEPTQEGDKKDEEESK